MSTATITGRCRAENPDLCRFHGNPNRKPEPETVAWFVQPPARPGKQPHSILTDVEPVAQALDAPARWEGETPAWWAGYQVQAEADNQTGEPAVPELLDIINTPMGEVAVIWHKNSLDDKDQYMLPENGMRVNQLIYYHPETGEKLGYLKATSASEESRKVAFGDDDLSLYRWAQSQNLLYGRNTIPSQEEWSAMTDGQKVEARKGLWRLVSSRFYLEDEPPADDATLQEVLQKEVVPDLQEQKEQNDTYFALPFIDFSRVNPGLKGQGYGTAMYIYTARRLAEEGQVLRGAVVQSADALQTWTRLKARFPDNIAWLNLEQRSGDVTRHGVLDFR